MDRVVEVGGFPEPPELPFDDGDKADADSPQSPNCAPGATPDTDEKVPTSPALNDGSIEMRPVNRLVDHPDAKLVPPMGDDEYKLLEDDIRLNGILEPLTILNDGQTLDGRNRLRAAKAAKISDVRCRVVTLPAGVSAVDWIIMSAVRRRHLTVGQRAAIGVELEAFLDARTAAAQKQANSRIRAGQPPKGDAAPAVMGSAPPTGEKSRDVAARMVGVSGTTIQHVLSLKADAPDLFAKVKSGDLTPNAATVELKKRSIPAAGRSVTGRRPRRDAGTASSAPAPSVRKWPLELLMDAAGVLREHIRSAMGKLAKAPKSFGSLRGVDKHVADLRKLSDETKAFAAALDKEKKRVERNLRATGTQSRRKGR